MNPKASSELKRKSASRTLLTPQQSCEEFFISSALKSDPSQFILLPLKTRWHIYEAHFLLILVGDTFARRSSL